VGGRRPPEEHVLQHPLGHGGSARVPDEVRTELTPTGATEGHVVPEDLALGAIWIDDRVHCDMRIRRLDGVVQLDVGELPAADHLLLGVDRQGFPRLQVMDVLLHDHVAPAAKLWIFVADQDGGAGHGADRVLGAVDEPKHVTHVEVLEPMGLAADRDRTAEVIHDLGGEREAQVEPLGPDVEQQVPGGGHRLVPGQ
jgi:hypothetical protein